jgi:hypothetical protein
MDNKDTIIRLLVGLIVIMVLLTMALNKPHEQIAPQPISGVCNVDSLQNVINNLQSDLKLQEDGFDKKEHRYEDIINEYQLGLSYLKDYHPKAYQDFHRIIGMKERYSFELERDNKKRLDTEYE